MLSASMPIAAFAVGLLSGVHCAGMCGGIVAAFSSRRVIPLRQAGAAALAPATGEWARQTALSAGRITSYAAAGALAGLAGSVGFYMAGVLAAQTVLYVLANLMLVLIGVQLAGMGAALAPLESIGAPLWRLVQPLAARLLPVDTLARAFAAGALWGWLPCGLVYGVLASAVLAGTPQGGALTMLAFGLGTLPNLLAAGVAAARVRTAAANPKVRIAAGALVLGFGVFGLAHSAGLAEAVRRGVLCFQG